MVFLRFQRNKKEAPTPRRWRKTSTPSVHLQGLEPWTPWLRVRCSSNWARGAKRIKLCPSFLRTLLIICQRYQKCNPLFHFSGLPILQQSWPASALYSTCLFNLSDNSMNCLIHIFISISNTWSDRAFLTKMCFGALKTSVRTVNCVRIIHWSFPPPVRLLFRAKLTYTRIYPHYPPKSSKNRSNFVLESVGTVVLFIM